MAKYLVPFEGSLLVEAVSWQQAEIMSVTWSQSLLRQKNDARSVKTVMNMHASRNGNSEVDSVEMQAVNISFALPPFADITAEIESCRMEIKEVEHQYRLKKGLPDTDLTDEQLILLKLMKERDKE